LPTGSKVAGTALNAQIPDQRLLDRVIDVLAAGCLTDLILFLLDLLFRLHQSDLTRNECQPRKWGTDSGIRESRRKTMTVPIITLTNGLRVANFSSPHPFQFNDGSVLPACPPERAKELMLNAIEQEVPHPTVAGITDIWLDWELPANMRDELAKLNAREDIDVLLIPFPVMTAIKNADLPIGKCRVIRVADRISKEIYIDRFCA